MIAARYPRKVLVMNASVDRHCPDGAWEKYAFGMLSEGECEPVEEHLLICSACQDSLAEADEYVRVVKGALVLLDTPMSSHEY
jgi:Putative zinc-finger